ncbi:MAG: S1 RNA-binding domain-containing protein [Acholeplasmatales bacterium]|nr:S1 RNA-binding domain-containing protein [Acholeplasmatales bacterium]
MENFEELFNESVKDLKVGDKVVGTVVSFLDDKTAAISIPGAFTEGIIHLDHYALNTDGKKFSDILKVGDEVEATVAKLSQDEHNYILLSRLDDAKKAAASEFAKDNEGKPFTVKVTGKVNKGYLAQAKGVKFFIPERDAETELKKGDTVKVILVKFDEERGSGLVSIKAVARAEEAKAKAEELSKINVGDTIEGTISRIEPYGVFVEFGSLRGLVRLKELSHVYIENPTSKYNVGDKASAKVISLENGKIDLSFKALTKSPIEAYADAHKVSDKVVGKVAQKLPFGAVLELAENVTGLLHKSEFSWNPNDNLLASLKIGDELEAAIIAIDVEKNKISLSKKVLIDNPWARVKAQRGDLIDAKVTEVTPKGLKIEALGVDGFISSRDINLDNNSNKLSDYYNEGDMVKAIITKVDPKAWVLNASIKLFQDEEARQEFEKYQDAEAEKDTPVTIGDILKSKESK